jgi:hypothetical protein
MYMRGHGASSAAGSKLMRDKCLRDPPMWLCHVTRRLKIPRLEGLRGESEASC